ncbi:MAG: outer membrane beta-barrel protein [bacterium]
MRDNNKTFQRTYLTLLLLGAQPLVHAFDTGMDPAYSGIGREYGETADAIGEGIQPGKEPETREEEVEEEDKATSILYPAVTTGFGWDDNIYRTENNDLSASYFLLNPSLVFQTAKRANRLFGGYRGNYAWYSDDPLGQLDYDDHTLFLGADHVGSKHFYGAYGEYQRGHDQPGGIDNTSDLFDEWDQYRVEAWWKYGSEQSKLNFRLDGAWETREHDRLRTNDLDSWAIAGLLKARFSGKTRGVIEGGLRHYDYEYTNQDADRYYARIGLAWDATSKTRGLVTWGYENFDPDNAGDDIISDIPGPVFGSNEEYEGQTWKAGIRWEPRERDTVMINSTRGSRLSSGVGSHKVSTRHDIAWTHLWSRRVRTHLAYALGDDDYQGVDRTDDLQEFQVSASYQWRRNLLLSGAWYYEDRDSNVATQSYDRNLVELLLKWEY